MQTGVAKLHLCFVASHGQPLFQGCDLSCQRACSGPLNRQQLLQDNALCDAVLLTSTTMFPRDSRRLQIGHAWPNRSRWAQVTSARRCARTAFCTALSWLCGSGCSVKPHSLSTYAILPALVRMKHERCCSAVLMDSKMEPQGCRLLWKPCRTSPAAWEA